MMHHDNSKRPASQPSCPSCGGAALIPLEMVGLDDVHSFYTACEKSRQELSRLVDIVDGHYSMRRCEACGLEFADPLKAPPSGWYDAAYSVLSLYPADRWEFSQVLAGCQGGDFLSEIGCGSGHFLKMCAIAGITAEGLDFSESAITQCDQQGLRARRLDVSCMTDGIEASQDRDLVVAFHVLEHLDCPDTMFGMAASLLKSSGKLLIAVPSDRRPSRRYGERDFLDQPPHHMTRWTPDSLRAIGQRNSWKLVSVRYEPMTLLGQLWSITVRLPLYRALAGGRKPLAPWGEFAVRALLLPLAMCRLLATRPPLSGHAMLAEYVRAQ